MKKILLSLLAAIGLGSASCSAQGGQAANTNANKNAAPSDGITVLAPQTFIDQAKADASAIILDVRTAKEYADGHLADAQNIDFLDTKAFKKGIKKFDKSHTYYVYCRSGRRSLGACFKMQKQGFKVFDMEGGILNWMKLGLPTVK